MSDKIKEIIGSVRFWQVVTASAVVYLSQIGYVDANTANMIAGILGVSVTIATVDKFGKNLKK